MPDITGVYGTISLPTSDIMPAVEVGVPIHTEIEYRLTVAPQLAKRRLVGRGRAEEEAPPNHGEWLLASCLPRGAPLEGLGRGGALEVTVRGLAPNTAYEIRLSVRYARLGSRKWIEVLSLAAATHKMDAEGKRMAAAPAPAPASAVATPRGGVARDVGVPPRVPMLLEAAAAAPSSHGVPESPRRLPPLQAGMPVPPSQPEEEPAKSAEAVVVSADLEEWTAAAQMDTEYMLGGGLPLGAAGRPVLGGGEALLLAAHRAAGGGDSGDACDGRPPGYMPFWRRDPADARPNMPAMPSSDHSAMQMDLCGRNAPFPPRQAARAATPERGGERGVALGGGALGALGAVPRPPKTSERTAYPRRVLYG